MTADSDPVQTPSQAIAYCKSAMGNVPIGSTAYLQLSAHLQGLEHPSHAAEIARLVGVMAQVRKALIVIGRTSMDDDLVELAAKTLDALEAKADAGVK